VVIAVKEKMGMMVNLQATQGAIDGSKLIAPQDEKQRREENKRSCCDYGSRRYTSR
jgi:hypothetical protein